MNVPVEFKAGQLIVAGRASLAINFNCGVQRKEPLGECLAGVANLLESLGAGGTPGFQEIKPLVCHDDLQILKQDLHVIVKQVVRANPWQVRTNLEGCTRDNPKLAHSCPNRVKEVLILLGGTMNDFAHACHNLQFQAVVGLGTVPPRGNA